MSGRGVVYGAGLADVRLQLDVSTYTPANSLGLIWTLLLALASAPGCFCTRDNRECVTLSADLDHPADLRIT